MSTNPEHDEQMARFNAIRFDGGMNVGTLKFLAFMAPVIPVAAVATVIGVFKPSPWVSPVALVVLPLFLGLLINVALGKNKTAISAHDRRESIAAAAFMTVTVLGLAGLAYGYLTPLLGLLVNAAGLAALVGVLTTMDRSDYGAAHTDMYDLDGQAQRLYFHPLFLFGLAWFVIAMFIGASLMPHVLADSKKVPVPVSSYQISLGHSVPSATDQQLDAFTSTLKTDSAYLDRLEGMKSQGVPSVSSATLATDGRQGLVTLGAALPIAYEAKKNGGQIGIDRAIEVLQERVNAEQAAVDKLGGHANLSSMTPALKPWLLAVFSGAVLFAGFLLSWRVIQTGVPYLRALNTAKDKALDTYFLVYLRNTVKVAATNTNLVALKAEAQSNEILRTYVTRRAHALGAQPERVFEILRSGEYRNSGVLSSLVGWLLFLCFTPVFAIQNGYLLIAFLRRATLNQRLAVMAEHLPTQGRINQ